MCDIERLLGNGNVDLSRSNSSAIRKRFAALSYYGTMDLGDEIQTIAAERFLPRVDVWTDRERLDEFTDDLACKIILNGWFLHRPEHWPPSQLLEPLIVSFHLTREIAPGLNEKMIAPSASVLGPDGVEFLKRHEPVGARDLDTLRQMRSAGVDAYFSGCLTLTLGIGRQRVPRNGVFAVDLPDNVFQRLNKTLGGERSVARLSHMDRDAVSASRFAKARSLIDMYARAELVVTTRLHCALPCVALETPVLLLESAPDSYRFDGLRDLVRHCSIRDFLDDNYDFDLKQPPANPTEWRSLRDGLYSRCRAFTGYGPR